uniref:Small heat-shock protein n=1 Tax=Rhizophora mucronata TaxID=61149 RepID=A0A2P2KCP9_RHIMU
MNVAESARNYIITVEVPGVNANDIRVEVDDKNLRVLGNRSIQNWRMTAGSRDLISAYHKREILQGPYQVAWPLPLDVNRDNVCAEFTVFLKRRDGLLQIIIPKL